MKKQLLLFLLLTFVSYNLIAQTILGIDVSHNQGIIVWSQVSASGKIYAWAKATEGVTFNDPAFYTNMANGSNAGMVMGAYHYARPDNNSAVDDANHFLSIAQTYIGTNHLPPALDLENIEDGNGNIIFNLHNIPPAILTAWVQTWMTTVQNSTGVAPVLYTNSDYTSYLNSSLNIYKLWIAKPDGSSTNPPGGLGVWTTWAFKQYSWTGTVPGINTSVDLDVFNGTTTDFNNLIGVNVGLPDLTVINQSVSSSTNPAGSNIIAYSAEHNSGNAIAGANIVSLYLSSDAVLTPGSNGDTYLGFINIPSVPAGNNSNIYASNIQIPNGTAPGNYYLFFWADGGQVINESNESNNFATVQITVTSSTQTYSINTSSSPTIGGSTSGGGTHPSGQPATVVATNNPGYTFLNWTENGIHVTSTPSYTFVVTGDRNLVANFTTCSYTLNSYSVTLYSPAQSYSFWVYTTSSCSWTASTSGCSWLTLNNSTGTGNGMVTFSITENTSSSARSCNITVGGQTFTLTQNGYSGPCSSPPIAPSNLEVVGTIGSNILYVGWYDNSTTETSFVVERAPTLTGPFTAIATLGPNSNGYADYNVIGGTSYCYRVKACCNSNCSAYTNIACQTACTYSITPTGVVTTADAICVGESVTLTVEGGNLGTGASWVWRLSPCHSGTIVGYGSTITITPSASGTYAVGAENGTCPMPNTNCAVKYITVNPLPTASTISANGMTTFCEGNSVTLTGNNGGIWSNGATTSSIAVNTSGDYFVTNSNACGNSVSNHILVTVVPFPIARAGVDVAICSGTSILIGSSPESNYIYSWSPSAYLNNTTIANPNASPMSTTTYTVTTTNSLGCSSTDQVTVSVNPLPDAVAGPNRAICQNTSTQIGATPVADNTYNWTSVPAGYNSTLADPIVAPLITTTYIVVETITATGCINSNSVTVTVNPAPAANAGFNNAICQNSSTQIGAAAVPGNTYSWTSIPPGFISTIANPTVSPVVTTTYFLTETITATGCSNSNSVVITVNPVPAANAGANRAICLNASTQIGSDPISGNTYTWTSIPVGFTSTIANPIVTPLATTIYTLTEIVLATGCTNTNSVVVTVNPLPVPSISGAGAVCAGVTGNPYTTQTGMNNYQWNISSGGTILSGLGTETIQVRWDSAGARFVAVNYANSFGCFASAPAVKNVTVYPLPVPTIAGPDSLCMNESGTYTTEAGMNNYQWVISPGGSIVTGLGTNTIHITWTSSGPRSVSVNYLNGNNCYAASPTIFNVMVFSLPVPIITGNSSVCEYSTGVPYSTETGMSNYVWATSSGGTITSGQGTSAITVSWGNDGSATVSVTYTSANGCNPTNSTYKTVTIHPRPVPSISGNTSVCVNSGPKTYSTEANQQNYIWEISPGDSILTGLGTSSVTVQWATSGSRWISVIYTSPSGCQPTAPDTLPVTVNPLPSAASAISGPSEVCAPAFWQQYSIDPITNAGGYFWTLPVGSIFQGSANSNLIHVAFVPNAQSGDITVYGTNACGNGASSTLSVTVNQIPPTPTITLEPNNILVSSATYGNQWHRNNQPMPGDTLNELQVIVTGDYYTIVTLSNCSSDTSNIKHVIIVGMMENKGFNVTVHPNPTHGKLMVDFISPVDKVYRISLLNELGVKIYDSERMIPKGESYWTIDISNVSPGLVLLLLQTTDGVIRLKIIKN